MEIKLREHWDLNLKEKPFNLLHSTTKLAQDFAKNTEIGSEEKINTKTMLCIYK
jgi:hypothetical protein